MFNRIAARTNAVLRTRFSHALRGGESGKSALWEHPRTRPDTPLDRAKAARTLVIYDFDLSMANETSDTWLLKQFDTEMADEFQDKIDAGFPCWVEEIDEMFKKLHAKGVSGHDIATKIRDIPVFDSNLQMINALGHAGATQMVVSDANTVYIQSFLHNYGLLGHFHSIYSNPSTINPITGEFSVKRFLDTPHSCHWCDDAPNMCKGEIFESILAEYGEQFDTIVFVSDGTNDYCGAKRLRPTDTVLCRRDLGLNGLLDRYGVDSVPPEVQFWSHGDDLQESIQAKLT